MEFSGSIPIDLYGEQDFRPPSRPRWQDVFPWLEDLEGEPADADTWLLPIEEARFTRGERAEGIAELLIDNHEGRTIAELMPSLPGNLDMTDLVLPKTMGVALHQNDVRIGSDLARETVPRMLDWRGVGVGKLKELFVQLIGRIGDAAVGDSAVTDEYVPVRVWHGPEEDEQREENPAEEMWREIRADLTELAEWSAAIGLPDTNLLGGAPHPAAPRSVTELREKLLSVTATDLLGEQADVDDLASLMDNAIQKIGDDRMPKILSERLSTPGRKARTLDEIGQDLGVTRERVRQLEKKAKDALLAELDSETTLGHASRSARAMIPRIGRLEDLLLVMPALAEEVPSLGCPVWEAFDALDDGYEIVDGWCLSPSEDLARAWTEEQLAELADDYGVVSLDDVDLEVRGDGINEARRTRQWLLRCGYAVTDTGHVLMKTRSVTDWAAALLSIQGEPMEAEEILGRFPEERSIRSLRNALNSDDRFERVGKASFGLAEWGLDSYKGIKPAIHEAIERHGGSIPLSVLIEDITGRFDVSENSVLTYASAIPFSSSRGVVTRASSNEYTPTKGPEDTARMYRRWDAWLWRLTVTGEHLRGSGTMAPMALVTVLDLKHGEQKLLASPNGDQSITWSGPQPIVGTIRRILMERDIGEGTQIFLVFRDDGIFDIEIVDELTGDPYADALRLIGSRPARSAVTARSRLATAIGLSAEANREEVIEALNGRGDRDLAQLISQAAED